MTDKRTTDADVVAELRDGMTIGIGGWGSRRKPMSLVRAILRSPLRDLTVVSYGGPDVGMLCAAGKVRKVVYGFVSLDSIPLEPHFRVARQQGAIDAVVSPLGHSGQTRAGTRRFSRTDPHAAIPDKIPAALLSGLFRRGSVVRAGGRACLRDPDAPCGRHCLGACGRRQFFGAKPTARRSGSSG